MKINVLWIILASAIGLATSQSTQPGPATTEANHPPLRIGTNCYINGQWYNPCPSPTPPPPPPDNSPGDLQQLE